MLLGALLLALAPATSALADHSATALISTGPSGGNGPYDVCPFSTCGIGISRDGRHVFFESRESLVSADTDSSIDVYERFGTTTTLVSTGPSGGNGEYFAQYLGASDDGSRVFFLTQEKLTSADTDDYFDVYERSGGATTLISTGPTGGNGPYGAEYGGASRDGTRVFFRTQEQLTNSDSDDAWDVYERSGGTTSLISTGNTPANLGYPAEYTGASADGTHVFFRTQESLDPSDTDNCSGKGCYDIYERFAGGIGLVSGGPSSGNPNKDVRFEGVSDDGAHVFFLTDEPLVSGDTDGKNDVYEHFGGATTLASTGPADQNQYEVCTDTTDFHVGGPCPVLVSGDGRLFWFTHEALVPGDTGYLDFYERSGGTTKLVSQGPTGGNGPYHVGGFGAISRDGTHAYFTTAEQLVSSDTDTTNDLYDRNGSTTILVSTGPTDTNSSTSFTPVGSSEDGSRVFFTTAAKLVPADVDSLTDIYERHAGTTTLISTGPADDGSATGEFMAANPDGSHVLFKTRDALVAGDTDSCPFGSGTGCYDIYDSSVAYEAPVSASPIHAALVPVFRQCGIGSNPTNGQHHTPLATAACLPPKPNAGQVAKIGPAAVGTVDLTVMPGNPDTLADEADAQLNLSLTDVQNLSGGGDYLPSASGADVTMLARLRLTDLANCSGSGCSGPYARNAATTTDFDFPVPIDCSATPDPAVGSTCALNSSLDAVQPGAATEGQQAVVQVFRVRLNDSGANTVRGDSDDRIFSTQGVYVP